MFSFHLTQEDLDNQDTMKNFQELMDDIHNSYVKEIESISKEYNIDNNYAGCIWYLRSRSRWTQELEDQLIQMSKDQVPPPNMCDWP